MSSSSCARTRTAAALAQAKRLKRWTHRFLLGSSLLAPFLILGSRAYPPVGVSDFSQARLLQL
ncbi:hypothetical protein IE53DRAFT_385099 [Violaceomyces palustris]|uniref:Uncharacterized protein n=1 Tax=Violaceomyces palustris TaxID=1673888 RepID=A0ACD0P2V8_9BASI|nr:hypothetical protein IE53DRAFT_385099 [Violaceomyces palustris]